MFISHVSARTSLWRKLITKNAVAVAFTAINTPLINYITALITVTVLIVSVIIIVKFYFT